MRRILRLCLLSALFIFFVTSLAPVARCADEIPHLAAPPMPTQTEMLALIKLVVSDLRQYAMQGDTELKKILETHGLDKDPDWDALNKDPDKSTDLVRKLSQDVTKAAANNSNAKAITQKYETLFSRETQFLWVYQSLVKDIAQYAKAGDKELDFLLQKDGTIVNSNVRMQSAHDIPSLPTPVDPSSPTFTVDVMNALQRLAMGLLELSKTNEHAKAIVEKYQIKQNQPAPPRP